MSFSLRALAGTAAVIYPMLIDAAPMRFQDNFYEAFLAPNIEWDAANAQATSLTFT
jgi:hypothetical protein